jgi:hypothetical protein
MIKIKPSSLARTKPGDYVLRFVLGGLVTAAAGLVAERWGPVVGGLFLAFPAIFPAAATMIETQERKKKEQAGLHAGKRGRMVAGVDAGGAALGTLGLAVFGLVIWKSLPGRSTMEVLSFALVGWALVAIGSWRIRRAL